MSKNLIHLSYHFIVLLLSAAIAFSIPHVFSALARNLLTFWAFIENEKIFLISLELSIAAMLITLKVWKPKDHFEFAEAASAKTLPKHHSAGEILRAWLPFALLVVCVLVWSVPDVKKLLNSVTQIFEWPGLHNLVIQAPPVTAAEATYAAR